VIIKKKGVNEGIRKKKEEDKNEVEWKEITNH
jgi:hypothetical protein